MVSSSGETEIWCNRIVERDAIFVRGANKYYSEDLIGESCFLIRLGSGDGDYYPLDELVFSEELDEYILCCDSVWSEHHDSWILDDESEKVVVLNENKEDYVTNDFFESNKIVEAEVPSDWNLSDYFYRDDERLVLVFESRNSPACYYHKDAISESNLLYVNGRYYLADSKDIVCVEGVYYLVGDTEENENKQIIFTELETA